MVNFNCQLTNFVNGTSNEFKCFDPLNSTTYLLVFNKNKDDDHYKSLFNCNVLEIYSDINEDNTLYLEMLQGGKNVITNENLKGMGRKLMRILLNHVHKMNTEHDKNYKYIFLYPSADLGKKDQEGLINIYKNYSFKKIGPCTYYLDGHPFEESGIKLREEGANPFDSGKNYLMVTSFTELNERVAEMAPDDNVTYLQKYLKYKEKYLNLKKTLK
jgi:hypothetical protein